MGTKAIDPEAARQIMLKAGVLPLDPFRSIRQPWRSRCKKCKRIVTPTYANVRNGHRACKYCAKGGVSQIEAMKILKELKVEPLVEYPGFKIPWQSKCLVCHRIISPRLSHIKKTKKACNYCNRRKVDPNRAKELAIAAGAIPQESYPGPRPWKCKCTKCKRIIFPTFRRIRNGQNPCGWCARVRIDPVEARKVFTDAGLKPRGDYPGAGKKWPAICLNCGAEVHRKLSDLVSGRYSCGYCSGRHISERDAIEIMKSAGALPLEPFRGQREKWRSKCLKCFREISPPFGNVRAGHAPCLYCSGKKVDSKSAYNFAVTKGVKPLQDFPGATQRWKVRCLKCGRDSTVSWVTLQMKKQNSGCSSCTEFGFKPLEPAYLYLITHETKKAHKIGIGNTDARRIEKHLHNGWEIYKVLEFKKGAQARQIEQQILSWLRNEKFLGPAYRTGDGWTETVSVKEISLQKIWRKVTELSRDKGKLVRKTHFN